MFFTFLKLYKWYQIAQRTTYQTLSRSSYQNLMTLEFWFACQNRLKHFHISNGHWSEGACSNNRKFGFGNKLTRTVLSIIYAKGFETRIEETTILIILQYVYMCPSGGIPLVFRVICWINICGLQLTYFGVLTFS